MWCEISNVPLRDGNGDVYEPGCKGYETGRDAELPDTCRSGRLQLYIESVGVFHQHRLYLTACVIDFLHVLEGLKFFTRKAHTLTPEEEAQFDGAEDEEDDEELHDDEADQYFNDKFDYTRNYGESIAVLTSIATYATMHPSMMFLGSTYYGFKYYVDKYQITNQYSKPRVQYGRRARSTTIYILWAQTLAQFYNSIYFMFLDGDMVIGGAMGMSAFFCLIVTTIYVYQPKAQKMAKTTSKADKKIERLQSTDASEVEARPLCGIYRPPRPEDLQVNLEIKGAASATNFDNPMNAQ